MNNFLSSLNICFYFVLTRDKMKKESDFSNSLIYFVGDEGVEPPTLCL
jgi:hypothetical protein